MSDPNPDDIFNQMDADSSGSISQRELADVYMEQYNLTDNVAQKTVEEIFHLLEIEQGSDVCLAESSELLTAMREVGIFDEEEELPPYEGYLHGSYASEQKAAESALRRRSRHLITTKRANGRCLCRASNTYVSSSGYPTRTA